MNAIIGTGSRPCGACRRKRPQFSMNRRSCDACLAKAKRQYYAKREHAKAYARRRRLESPEAARAADRRYREANRLKRAAHQRARYRRTGYRELDLVQVYQRDGGSCGICGLAVERPDATMDHVVPLAAGGLHSYENVQLAHRRCNERKGVGHGA